MNALMIKGLAFAVILMGATVFALKSMGITFQMLMDDPIKLLTVIGAGVIIILSVAVSFKYINQMKTDTASGELADENWDGIGEYKNQIPSGWAYSWVGTMIWAMWYMISGYPVNAFSQIGQYNEEVLSYNAKYEEKYKNPSPEVLQQMGESIFLVQCAPCHGTTGDGLSGKAQDLTKRMSKAQVLAVIEKGSNQLAYPMGAMPPMMATGQDAEDIAAYIAGGMKGEQPASFAACASCHGADGKGMDGMAPNLAQYDDTLVTHVLENGKKGIIGRMPSFKTMITPVQEKALTEYIQSLSN